MRVSEQLDHHGVEPNPLPAAAGTLHALAQVWIVLRSRKPREQSDADRQRHHERRCGVDGERRSLVHVVKARDDAIKHSATRDLPLGIRSGARSTQKQQMQQGHHKRGSFDGQGVDVGDRLFATPRLVPEMLEPVIGGIGLTAV